MQQINEVPQCVGLILDGNRRWAKNQGKPTLEGHRAGLDTLETITYTIRDRNIPHMVVYAFSTENWQRSEEEVSYLMNLIVEGVREKFSVFKDENIRIKILGEKERLPKNVQDAVANIEKDSESNTGLTLWVCLSYGSRQEVVTAANAAAKQGEITEESLRAHMWSADMPDPDLIIRTSGEQRLSNFLMWQAAYSELFFTDTLWPDFTAEELDRILEEYAARDRRRGK